MDRILKYPISLVSDEQEILVPVGAEVIAVAEQHGAVCMWVVTSDDAPLELRHFVIVGTGETLPRDDASRRHVGSVVMANGMFVWHLFELMAAVA